MTPRDAGLPELGPRRTPGLRRQEVAQLAGMSIDDHPQAGPPEFECQVLHIAETGQRIIAYCAAPGSPTESAFIRLGSGVSMRG